MFFGLFGSKVNAAVKAEIEGKIARYDGLALFDYASMTVADNDVMRRAARNNQIEVGVYKTAEVEAAIEGGKFYGILDGVGGKFGLLFFNTEEELVNFSVELKKFRVKNPIFKMMLKGWPLPLEEILAKIPEEPKKRDFAPGDYRVDFMGSERKVAAIKALRELTGLDLYTSKEIVDGRQSHKMSFATQEQIDAFERAFADTGSTISYTLISGSVTNVQDDSAYVIDDGDGTLNFQIIQMKSAVMAIKLYRELSGLGLKESKDAIDSGYIEIRNNHRDVQEIVNSFADIGCYIERRR